MQNEGRRNARKSSTLFTVALIAVMLLVVIVGVSVFFTIEEVRVEGTGVYDPAEIAAASGIEPESSIFFVSESITAVRLKNAFPYVEEVRIRRELPGTVVIQVTEAPPVAAAFSGESWWILSAHGKLLERTDSIAGRGLMELAGVTPLMPALGQEIALGEGESVRRQYLLDTLSALWEAGLTGKVSWLDLTSLSEVTFLYEDRLTVRLGRADTLEDKLWLLLKIAGEHPQGAATVDLSAYPKGNYIPR
ncbi:MAG: cell division protein FtsQ/DivIB [bacterium]